jgi:hypothetical protein
MTNNPIFYVNTIGDYPTESYRIRPLTGTAFKDTIPFAGIPTWSGFWADLGTLMTRNFLNYSRNPLNQILDTSNVDYNNIIYYTNSTYLTSVNSDQYPISTEASTDANGNVYIERPNTIELRNDSSIYFNTSALRGKYKTPYEFEFFYIRLNDTAKNSYGYMLYPNKIYLKPTQLNYNSGTKTWTLKTKAKILSGAFVSISETTLIEQDAYLAHKQRLNSIPTTIDLPDILNSNQLIFRLFGCRTRVDVPILTFDSSTIPTVYSDTLDNDISYVYPDSTFITFSSTFVDVKTKIKYPLAQSKIDNDYTKIIQTFNPTYILKSSLLSQTFQLIQQSLNPNTNAFGTIPMSDSSNCVLSAVIGYDGSFNFYNYYTPAKISFQIGSYLGLNYMIDSSKLLSGTGNILNTLTNFKVNGITKTIGSSLSCLEVGTYDIDWETTYPPHSYAYKIELSNSSGLTYLDSNSLNFYLKLSAVNQSSNSVTLSAFIASDFNELKYGFTNQMSDQISYQILSTSLTSIDAFLKNVVCTWGSNETRYTLTQTNASVTPPIISVVGGKDLTLTYNGSDFVGVTFTIKASIQNGANIVDTFEPLTVTLKRPDNLSGNSIFLNTISEQSNSIVLDSSFNVNASGWPSRDLSTPPTSGSQILWDWYYGTPGNKDPNVSFFYVDANGDYIDDVNGPINFSDQSWTVSLSGYGPNMATISLSSQKYNEVARKNTNPNLYNFLQNGKFIVTPISTLNNLDLTRTIQLKAQIPYGNQIYNIPSSVPIYWTWEYDGIIDPDLQPITANQILNNNIEYDYSKNAPAPKLSAIQINVTPGYSKTIPKVHKVTVIAYTDIVTPPVSGSYTFYVDDFPDKSIFNTDFESYYTEFSTLTSQQIANTRYDNDTITRPNGYPLNCKFKANSDVLSRIKNANKYWTFNDVNTLSTTDTFTKNFNDPTLGLPTSISYGYPITSAKIGLNLYSAIAPGWTSAHNVSATTYIYILSSSDFYKPLNFINYPEYAWIPPNPTYVTLLSTDPSKPNYYTYSYRPSAFSNKKFSSQTFWVSANKNCFTEYLYQNNNTYDIVQTVSSYSLIDIKYNPFDTTASVGIPISLVAYNDTFYPETTDIPYLIEKTVNGEPTLVTEYHNITAKTIEFTEPTNDLVNNFFLSPVILPYNYLTLNFVPNQINIDLDVNGNISVNQTLGTLPSNAPAIITGGTVTYYLSSRFWTVSANVPAINGTYNLFKLVIGDPAIPLNSGDLGLDNFYLYAKTNVLQQIPSSTFDNYTTVEYSKDRDLWNTITV